MRIHTSTLLAVAVTALLVGCASTHQLRPESVAVQPDLLQVGQSLKGTPIDAAAWPHVQWWMAYGDPQLNELIDAALDGNPSLRVAEARTRAALAQVAAVDSSRYPSAGLSGQAVRGRFSEHGLLPAPLAGNWDTLAQLTATLSWQVDFWGKNRAAYESAVGAERAAEVDTQAARLALAANVAHVYARLQEDSLQLHIARDTLAQREQVLSLTRDRNAAGLDSRLELTQAQAALPAAREQIDALEEAATRTRHALAALTGAGPDRALSIHDPTVTFVAAASLPTAVPAELLGHRPDLVAQRWRVEAASQGIREATAEFYPNVDLLAFVGLQNLGSTTLLSAANRQYGLAPAFTLPLFDAGKRRAKLAAQDAQYDAAVEQYNQLVTDALREVVDALSSMDSLVKQHGEERDALANAQEAYDLSVLRYREGLGNYLQVLSAESQLLAQRSLEAQLQARSLDLSVELVQALGGGFLPQALPPAIPASTPPLAQR
ncbi:MAG TPA: efflux transporter outer membrane subunit [Steroidobacteraceae bacterium]|jgi:NodT family efflux transporter outer membrane factor (OMF) lipoprotein